MHILSYGGGVNSVALMLLLMKQGEPLDEVVFADTGAEVPETYEHIEIAKKHLERHDIPFTTLSKRPGRDLYSTCWRRRVTPSAIWRWSTRDFKVNPIYRHYRTLGAHVNQYLAIAYDEIERMKDSKVAYVTNLFPLVDQKVTRAGCIELIEEAGMPIPVKSGCFFCPFNNMGRWQWLHEKHPDLFEKAVALEEHSKHFPKQRLTDEVFRKRDVVLLRNLPARFETADDVEQVPCGGECMT